MDHDTMIVVRDNQFERRWGNPANATVRVEVAPDGTFNSSASWQEGRTRPRVVTIKGRITGGDLEADMGSDRCAVHLSLKKS
jgi:hypothetical protein